MTYQQGECSYRRAGSGGRFNVGRVLVLINIQTRRRRRRRRTFNVGQVLVFNDPRAWRLKATIHRQYAALQDRRDTGSMYVWANSVAPQNLRPGRYCPPHHQTHFEPSLLF
jgi:hypothetical protein